MSKMDKKGDFSSKMANIDSKYDSFMHFTIKFNSKDNLISIFSGIFNSKNYSITYFPRKFNSKINPKHEFSLINVPHGTYVTILMLEI